MIFVEIFRFIEADPDPSDQNETDPNGSGSATLVSGDRQNCFIFSVFGIMDQFCQTTLETEKTVIRVQMTLSFH